jgi:hypothetical protein
MHGAIEATRFRRIAHAQKQLHTTLASERATIHETTGLSHSISTTQMKKFRVSNEINKNERIEEMLGVAGLQSSILPSSISLAPNTVQQRRKVRHDRALSNEEQQIALQSEQIEEKVISKTRKLRDFSLLKIDKELDNLITRTYRTLDQEQKHGNFIMDLQIRINDLLRSRNGHVEDFIVLLQTMEKERCDQCRSLLRAFVRSLVNIGYLLRPEIARLVEKKAEEINFVVAGNIRAIANISARMRRLQAEQEVTRRRQWAEIESSWKLIRHKKAIQDFETVLSSAAFTNPPSRQKWLSEAKTQAHLLLKQRASLVASVIQSASKPMELSTAFISKTKKNMMSLNLQDEEIRNNLKKQLNEGQKQLQTDSHNQVEKLRLKLHTYGSLIRIPPGIGEIHGRLKSLLLTKSEASDKFYRESGTLKSTLLSILSSLESGYCNLMYPVRLNEIKNDLTILCDSLTLQDCLVYEGKGNLVKSVVEIGNRIRLSNKSQINPLFVRFLKVLDRICQCKGLPRVFARRLEGLVKLGRCASRNVAKSKMDSSDNSVDAKISTDMLELRRVHRSIMALIQACNLPVELKNELSSAKKCLLMQEIANSRVDIVIRDETAEIIEKRVIEYSMLCNQTILCWQAQSDIVVSVYSSYIQTFWKAAALYERHTYTSLAIDQNIKYSIAIASDENDDHIGEINSQIDAVLLEIRHAENEKQLKQQHKKVLELLVQLEKSYLGHFDKMNKLVNSHTEKLSAERNLHLGSLNKVLGLRNTQSDGMSNTTSANKKNRSDAKYLHPSFFGSIFKRPMEMKPITCFNGRIRPVNEDYSHPLQILQPTIKPISPNLKSEHPAAFGYALYKDEELKNNRNEEMIVLSNQRYAIIKSITEMVRQLYVYPDVFNSSLLPHKIENGISQNWLDFLNILGPCIPVDRHGEQCIECYLPPLKLLEDGFESLRLSLVNFYSKNIEKRSIWANELKKNRIKYYTAQVEERLRLHWPRKGRAEVNYVQPRIGELQNHKRRLARHVRTLMVKSKTYTDKFEKEMVKAQEEVKQFQDQIVSLVDMLQLQSTLAGLQGILMRGKECKRFFLDSCQDILLSLTKFTNLYPDNMTSLNKKFLGNSVTFDEGGEYAIKELNICTAKIEQLQNNLDMENGQRKTKILDLKIMQEAALGDLKTLEIEFEKALQNLSMREGLGKKYGAPRRAAQEKNRMVLSRFEDALIEIDTLMQSIEKKGDNIQENRPRQKFSLGY